MKNDEKLNFWEKERKGLDFVIPYVCANSYIAYTILSYVIY